LFGLVVFLLFYLPFLQRGYEKTDEKSTAAIAWSDHSKSFYYAMLVLPEQIVSFRSTIANKKMDKSMQALNQKKANSKLFFYYFFLGRLNLHWFFMFRGFLALRSNP
jgi:hypothetical protein